VRAFCLTGQKALYDGVDARSGQPRYKAVSPLQERALAQLDSLPRASPGSYIDFAVNPTITALTPLHAVAGFRRAPTSLHTAGLLDALGADFSRALAELAAILADLQRLAALGDLPLTYRGGPAAPALRVHFPGCDAAAVDALAAELGLCRGVVAQDPDFDVFAGARVALLFPFAPSAAPSERGGGAWERAPPWMPDEPDPILFSDGESVRSECGFERDAVDVRAPLRSPTELTGFESVRSSELESEARVPERYSSATPLEYQGFEGIYRFIEMCDASARK